MGREQYSINGHGERIVKLETRMDGHDEKVEETKKLLGDLQKEQKWQTKQIFMGLGGIAVLYIVVEILFKVH